MQPDYRFNYTLDTTQKANKLGQKPLLIWITGLSASGKSTLANELDLLFFNNGYKSVVLDGDTLRKGISSDLGFAETDRTENIRRTAEISKLFLQTGMIVLAPLISPTNIDREMVKNIVGEEYFCMVFLDTDIKICENRDPKGLYAKARRGEIQDFTGIHQPYEKPIDANLSFKDDFNISDATMTILNEYKRLL
jgi:adenylyl-sulfate kinase